MKTFIFLFYIISVQIFLVLRRQEDFGTIFDSHGRILYDVEKENKKQEDMED